MKWLMLNSSTSLSLKHIWEAIGILHCTKMSFNGKKNVFGWLFFHFSLE